MKLAQTSHTLGVKISQSQNWSKEKRGTLVNKQPLNPSIDRQIFRQNLIFLSWPNGTSTMFDSIESAYATPENAHDINMKSMMIVKSMLNPHIGPTTFHPSKPKERLRTLSANSTFGMMAALGIPPRPERVKKVGTGGHRAQSAVNGTMGPWGLMIFGP